MKQERQKAIIADHNWQGCEFQTKERTGEIDIIHWEHDFEKHTITIIYTEKNENI